jgi:hypothetical protein
LTFDELYAATYSASLSGSEVVGLYVALSHNEEGLDLNQRSALERLRSILYESLSVEDLEGLQRTYATRLSGGAAP